MIACVACTTPKPGAELKTPQQKSIFGAGNATTGTVQLTSRNYGHEIDLPCKLGISDSFLNRVVLKISKFFLFLIDQSQLSLQLRNSVCMFLVADKDSYICYPFPLHNNVFMSCEEQWLTTLVAKSQL